MVDFVQIFLDTLMFKLSFHTYEELQNKFKITQKKQNFNPQDEDDLDLFSNDSDESRMTIGGTPSVRERKLELIEEKIDIKLNRILMKWIVVCLFYQLQWVWRILGWFLPAITAIRIFLGFWIMLPQFKGEFYLWHMIEEYLKRFESLLMVYRTQMCSNLKWFFGLLDKGALKMCITYISEEAIVMTEEAAQETLELLKIEMMSRVERNSRQVRFPTLGTPQPPVQEYNPSPIRKDSLYLNAPILNESIQTSNPGTRVEDNYLNQSMMNTYSHLPPTQMMNQTLSPTAASYNTYQRRPSEMNYEQVLEQQRRQLLIKEKELLDREHQQRINQLNESIRMESQQSLTQSYHVQRPQASFQHAGGYKSPTNFERRGTIPLIPNMEDVDQFGNQIQGRQRAAARRNSGVPKKNNLKIQMEETQNDLPSIFQDPILKKKEQTPKASAKAKEKMTTPSQTQKSRPPRMTTTGLKSSILKKVPLSRN